MSGGGSVAEVTGSSLGMEQALFHGLDTLDLNQTVNFVKYNRVVLPLDGFVFWVKAAILSPSALVNTWALNNRAPNQPSLVVQPADQFQAQGSLHHTTVNKQDATDSSATHRMIFTSKQKVNDLSDIAPNSLYMATTGANKYAFSVRSGWYKQAGLYHYSGDAVYPVLGTQVIDNPADLNLYDRVVSNSLPVWLTFNWLFPVYPSYLVPDNIFPPYAVIDIGEDDTTPMQSGAMHDGQGSRFQLAKDTVTVTTYGVRNDTIMDWLDMITEYTLKYRAPLGIMNSPIPRDSKRGQAEISTLAQKKVISFDASYYQSRMNHVARQLITSAFLDEFLPVPDPNDPSGIGHFIIGESAIGEASPT